jgi:hypothetical protein
VYNYQAPRRRRGIKALIWVAAVLVLLVGLDFGAKAFAENAAASQMQKRGFPSKPNVSIAGFPFLTQVITRHFQQITITSSNIPAGPLRITSLTVVADNVHLSGSFQSGTAGPLHGTIVISLGSLGSALSAAGPLVSFVAGGSKILTIKSVGTNEVKGSLNLAGGLGGISGSAVWQVSRAGPAEINLHKVSSSGVFSSLPSDITLPVSSLPAGLTLTGGLNASASGITAHVYARSVSFGG